MTLLCVKYEEINDTKLKSDTNVKYFKILIWKVLSKYCKNYISTDSVLGSYLCNLIQFL